MLATKVFSKIYAGNTYITSERWKGKPNTERFTIRQFTDKGESVIVADSYRMFAYKQDAERYIERLNELGRL